MHGETADFQRQELTPVGERETTKKKTVMNRQLSTATMKGKRLWNPLFNML